MTLKKIFIIIGLVLIYALAILAIILDKLSDFQKSIMVIFLITYPFVVLSVFYRITVEKRDNTKKKSEGTYNKPTFIIIGLVSAFLIIILPMLIEILVFSNNIYSKLDNGEWASFLGSYIGSIIGAVIAGIITLVSVTMTINYSKSEAKKDRNDNKEINIDNQISSIKPYLQLSIHGMGGSSENGFVLSNNIPGDMPYQYWRLSSKFKNIGLGSAINVECKLDCRSSSELSSENNVFYNYRAFGKDETTDTIDLIVEVNKAMKNSFEFTIKFDDLLGNVYNQTFKIEIPIVSDYKKISYYSEMPILIKRFDKNK